jgi:uroporphyrinogen-III synthase
VYRRTRVTPSLAALAEFEAAVRAPTRPVVAATSAEVLEALIESLPPALLEGVRASTLLVPGARVASRAQALGWHGRVVMSATAEDESMLATLTQALAGKSPPGP